MFRLAIGIHIFYEIRENIAGMSCDYREIIGDDFKIASASHSEVTEA